MNQEAVAIKPCDNCGKKMVLTMTSMDFGGIHPVENYEWWCKCGHSVESPSQTDKRHSCQEVREDLWNRGNDPRGRLSTVEFNGETVTIIEGRNNAQSHDHHSDLTTGNDG